jgi:ubiquitin-like modifier-activating enzyme ATG7
MPVVQFTPLSSLVEPTFWHALTDLKIDVLRLSDDAVPIAGTYTVGKSIKDRETGREIALGCNISFSSESFSKDGMYVATNYPAVAIWMHLRTPQPISAAASGIFKNYNTIEEFKDAPKTEMFNAEANKARSART